MFKLFESYFVIDSRFINLLGWLLSHWSIDIVAAVISERNIQCFELLFQLSHLFFFLFSQHFYHSVLTNSIFSGFSQFKLNGNSDDWSLFLCDFPFLFVNQRIVKLSVI